MDYLLTVVARNVTELQQVLAALAARGGQRLVTYLRLEEIKPPSRLPLLPARRPARPTPLAARGAQSVTGLGPGLTAPIRGARGSRQSRRSRPAPLPRTAPR